MKIIQEIPRGTFEEDYRDMQGVRASALKAIQKGPAHYKHFLTAPSFQTDSFKVGDLVHFLALQPHRFGNRYVVRPSGMKFSTKDGKAWKAEQEQGGKIIIDDINQVHGINESIWGNTQAADLLRGATSTEAGRIWECEETGVVCKARFDAIDENRGILIDIKTTSKEGIEGFRRQAADLLYDVQLAHYMAAYPDIEAHALIVVETKAPYPCQVYTLSPQMMLEAQARRYKLLEQIRDLKLEDVKNCYHESPIELLTYQESQGQRKWRIS